MRGSGISQFLQLKKLNGIFECLLDNFPIRHLFPLFAPCKRLFSCLLMQAVDHPCNSSYRGRFVATLYGLSQDESLGLCCSWIKN